MTEILAWSILPSELGTDPAAIVLFLALGSLSAMLVSMAKAGFGGSIGILSVPLMVYACGQDPYLATGIMLPLLIACDYVAMVGWWGKWNPRAVWLLLPGAAAGVVLGAATLWWLKSLGAADSAGSKQANAALMLGIGLIAIGFVIFQAVRSLRKNPITFRPAFWQGTGVGAAAGYTSTLAHAAGPIVSMYMLTQRMPPSRFVASTVLYYWIGNQLKLAPYFLLGMINVKTFAASAVLLPAVVAGALLGLFLHHKVGPKRFTPIVYTLVAIAGAQLIRSALMTLWW